MKHWQELEFIVSGLFHKVPSKQEGLRAGTEQNWKEFQKQDTHFGFPVCNAMEKHNAALMMEAPTPLRRWATSTRRNTFSVYSLSYRLPPIFSHFQFVISLVLYRMYEKKINAFCNLESINSTVQSASSEAYSCSAEYKISIVLRLWIVTANISSKLVLVLRLILELSDKRFTTRWYLIYSPLKEVW